MRARARWRRGKPVGRVGRRGAAVGLPWGAWAAALRGLRVGVWEHVPSVGCVWWAGAPRAPRVRFHAVMLSRCHAVTHARSGLR